MKSPVGERVAADYFRVYTTEPFVWAFHFPINTDVELIKNFLDSIFIGEGNYVVKIKVTQVEVIEDGIHNVRRFISRSAEDFFKAPSWTTDRPLIRDF